MKAKSEAFTSYKVFEAWLKTQLNLEIKCLHTDRGGEYLGNDFVKYLEERGVERKLTIHDTPEENEVAERLNRTLMEKVRAMIFTSQLPTGMWGEALMHAVFLKNCTWTWALPEGLTPFEMVNNEKPVLKDLPVWGSIVWVHDTSSGKLGARAKEGHWVGYNINSNGHRIFWRKKRTVTVERNIVFSKEELPTVVVEDDVVLISGGEMEEEEDVKAPVDGEDAPPPINQTLPEIRRSTRLRNPSRYVRDVKSGEFQVMKKIGELPIGLQDPFKNGVLPEMIEVVDGIAMAVQMGEDGGFEPGSLQEAM
jgi:hypothetical protein